MFGFGKKENQINDLAKNMSYRDRKEFNKSMKQAQREADKRRREREEEIWDEALWMAEMFMDD
ncbi:MAG: hypothetical protein K6F86_00660 [Lachnospiraceae bacterium]|nr:hypothetical protein [Lachnospiraceae bacterium]